MAAMTTVLTYLSSKGDNLTYILPLHTVNMPKYCNVLRNIPGDNSKVQDYAVQIAHGVADADGNPIPQKLVGEVRLRVPVNGDVTSADIASFLATLQDVAFSDEGKQTLEWGTPPKDL